MLRPVLRDAWRLLRPHGACERCPHFEALRDQMDAAGWRGAPLVAVRLAVAYRPADGARWGYRYQAINGSHRITAARELGLRVPVVTVRLRGAARRALLADPLRWYDTPGPRDRWSDDPFPMPETYEPYMNDDLWGADKGEGCNCGSDKTCGAGCGGCEAAQEDRHAA